VIKICLKELLEQQGLSQSQLSELSGVRRARINQMCNGDVERLELEHIEKICKALKVKPWDWIVWTDEDNNTLERM
jgi:putative transcriptional regulator